MLSTASSGGISHAAISKPPSLPAPAIWWFTSLPLFAGETRIDINRGHQEFVFGAGTRYQRC